MSVPFNGMKGFSILMESLSLENFLLIAIVMHFFSCSFLPFILFLADCNNHLATPSIISLKLGRVNSNTSRSICTSVPSLISFSSSFYCSSWSSWLNICIYLFLASIWFWQPILCHKHQLIWQNYHSLGRAWGLTRRFYSCHQALFSTNGRLMGPCVWPYTRYLLMVLFFHLPLSTSWRHNLRKASPTAF